MRAALAARARQTSGNFGRALPTASPAQDVETAVALGLASAGQHHAVACRCWMRQAGLVLLEVRRIGGDGRISRVDLDTAGRNDAARWEKLAESCYLQVPPPYHPEPGQPVYEVCVDDRVVQTAESDLGGPLGQLIAAVLAEGDVR